MHEIRQWTIEDTIKHEEGYSIASFHLDHAIYVLPDHREVEVNIQGLSEDKQEAILLMAAHKADFPQLERDGLVIFHARRSSEEEKTPETWYWTEAQIQDDLNDPDDEDDAEEIRPRTSRKNEIIVLGHELGKTKEQIQAQLRAEGFSEDWSESAENGQRIISFPAVVE